MGGESELGCYLILNTGCPPAWHIIFSIPLLHPLTKQYLDFTSYSTTLNNWFKITTSLELLRSAILKDKLPSNS